MNFNYWKHIANYLSKNCSSQEEKELRDWIEENPNNKELFKEAKELWQAAEDKSKFFQPDEKAAWEKITAKINTANQTGETNVLPFLPVKRKQLTQPLFWVKIAAGIALLIGMGYLINMNIQHEQPTVIKEEIAQNDIVETWDTTLTTQDKLDVFYLPDSSLIWMNKKSTLSYSETFNQEERAIHFEGEGYFEIKQDSTTPFVIYTNTVKITVLGTSFNLKTYKDETDMEIVVVSGKVTISLLNNTNNNIVLTANERAVFNHSTNVIKEQKSNATTLLSWKEDKKQFKHSDLYQQEIINPIDNLISNSEWHKGFLSRTEISGEIHNTAVIASFKDIRLQINYFSRKGKKIATKYFYIHKTIEAYSFITYKEKLNDWYKNTDKVTIEIVDADVAD